MLYRLQVLQHPVCRASHTERPAESVGQQLCDQNSPTQTSTKQHKHINQSHEQQPVCQWLSRAGAAASAAVFAAAAVLSPMSVPSAAAHEGMDHSMTGQASAK